MQQTDHTFTDQQLQEGFLQSDEPVLEYIYSHLRPEVLSAIIKDGGSTADGNAFFIAAAADMTQLLRQNVIPESVSFSAAFNQLALAHYRAWLQQQPASAQEAADVSSSDPVEEDNDELNAPVSPVAPAGWLPSSAALGETRKHIFTWKALGKLAKGCTEKLLNDPSASSPCKAELATILLSSGDRQINDFTLPEWAEPALQRKEDYGIWQKMRQYEQSLSRGLTIDGQERSSGNAVAKYLFLFLLAVTLGYLCYAWFNKPKPAGEIFKEHFEPPQSLMADINSRFVNDSSGITRPPVCEDVLKEVDALYGEKKYEDAIVLLQQMIETDEMAGCKSDALFAMGIIYLKMDEPGETLQCLAKIDNIEAYGEDLYWYQSLAFVQLAKSRAGMRPAAQKAVERFMENTKNEERREEAKKMLEQL